MPRYLTAPRLTLLVLTIAYQERNVSTQSSLAVLDFLAHHINNTQDHDQEAVSERLRLSSEDISFFASRLSQWTTPYPGRSVYDLLLHGLWALNGIDSLRALIFQDMTDAGWPTLSSPLGHFIRRCGVEWTRLQFADQQALYNEFVAYRAPSYEHWAKKNPDSVPDLQRAIQSSAIPGLSDEPLPETTKEHRLNATIDTDMLLSFAIHHLQRLGTRIPEEVKPGLEKWIGDLGDSGTQSLRFFVAFFEHWRAGQYTMALESLHRYFDYSLVSRSSPTDNMRIYYQYALLHLSVLHADFECWDESVDAMNECIATGMLHSHHKSWHLRLRPHALDVNDADLTQHARITTPRV